MREKESGVILFITYYYEGGRGGGEGELRNVKFLLSIRLGWGGGGKNLSTIVLPLPIDSCGQSKIKDRLPPSE